MVESSKHIPHSQRVNPALDPVGVGVDGHASDLATRERKQRRIGQSRVLRQIMVTSVLPHAKPIRFEHKKELINPNIVGGLVAPPPFMLLGLVHYSTLTLPVVVQVVLRFAPTVDARNPAAQVQAPIVQAGRRQPPTADHDGPKPPPRIGQNRAVNTVRVGFVGVGQIAQHHLRTYRDVPGVQVVAACDTDAAALAKSASEYNIPFTTGDFRELIARDDIDAVDVCLHNNLHAPVTIAALEAGKHVYCEKPMAGAYVDAVAMAQAAERTGKKLSIQLSTLYSPHTKLAKRLIEAGHLGKVYHARSTGHRRRGRPYVDGYGTSSFVRKATASGGALYDMGVYHIAMMLHLLGNPSVERITGKTYQETDMDPGRRELGKYDVEELGLGFVRLGGGLTLDIVEAWAVHQSSFEAPSVYGSKGGLKLDPLSYFTNLEDVPMNATFEVEGADWRKHVLDPKQQWFDSPQHHWIGGLLGEIEMIPTAELALKTMLISEGIYLSERLGREVTPEEVAANSVSTAIAL